MAVSAECQCEDNFTCRYCCRNAKPYLFTPSSVMAVWKDKPMPLASHKDKLKEIAKHLQGIAKDDLTTSEMKIVKLLIEAQLMSFDEHDETKTTF